MWMVVKVQDTEILRCVLDRWKAAIDAQEPERVSDVFTEDAIFQGLHPYSVGRQGVANYYATQPRGIAVSYRILETRRPSNDLVLGYVNAQFTFPERPAVNVNLGVLATRGDGGWRIMQYQASPAV